MDQDWPAQNSELWPIEKITPYARNFRTQSDEQVAQIAASIREWAGPTRCSALRSGNRSRPHGATQFRLIRNSAPWQGGRPRP